MAPSFSASACVTAEETALRSSWASEGRSSSVLTTAAIRSFGSSWWRCKSVDMVSVMLVGTRKRKKKITQREVRDRVCSRLYRHGLGGVEKLY